MLKYLAAKSKFRDNKGKRGERRRGDLLVALRDRVLRVSRLFVPTAKRTYEHATRNKFAEEPQPDRIVVYMTQEEIRALQCILLRDNRRAREKDSVTNKINFIFTYYRINFIYINFLSTRLYMYVELRCARSCNIMQNTIRERIYRNLKTGTSCAQRGTFVRM